MQLRSLALSLSFAAMLAVAACGGSDSPIAPSDPPPAGGGTTPTLASLSSQIFSQRCVGCHGGSAPEQRLNLEAGRAHASLVNVASTQKQGAILVIPGNPDGSYLVQKLRGDAGIVGLRMPRDGAFLTADQIDLVRQWIQAGALNN